MIRPAIALPWRLWPAVMILFGLAGIGATANANDAPDSLSIRCEYGVTLALRGELASAETVFVSLLSRSPSDPRALTNLGNLHLLGGNTELALAFYDRAVRADSGDGGIRLNRSVAYLLLGDQERAIEEAADGARRAGSEQAAAAMLGIRHEGGAPDEDKGASKTRMTREEIRVLLSVAVKGVPKDTTTIPTSPTLQTGERKKPALTLRPAGPRGAGEVEATTLLYWKQ